MKKRNQYTKQKKAEIVLELLKEEKTIAQISSEYGIHPTQLNQWKKTALEGLPELFERGVAALREKGTKMVANAKIIVSHFDGIHS